MGSIEAMRDQAVRVALGIPAATVARMAKVNRGTLTRYEISPDAVADPERRERCAQIYRELRAMLSRYPLPNTAA